MTEEDHTQICEVEDSYQVEDLSQFEAWMVVSFVHGFRVGRGESGHPKELITPVSEETNDD